MSADDRTRTQQFIHNLRVFFSSPFARLGFGVLILAAGINEANTTFQLGPELEWGLVVLNVLLGIVGLSAIYAAFTETVRRVDPY